jgi:hypothetical protein
MLSVEYTASNGEMNEKLWIWRDLERRGIIELLSRNLRRETEENDENSNRIAGFPAEIRTEHLPNMYKG